MEEILDQCQCGLCYYAGMAILEEGVWLGTYILTYIATQQYFLNGSAHSIKIVKLREREGQGVDPGRSLKGHLWMVDGGWWYTFP